MKELIKEMRACMLSEYDRATAIHGSLHNSPHEAYTVILEEVEEANDVLDCDLKSAMTRFWNAVKRDFDGVIDPNEAANEIKDAAISAAAELIQVAAMAHKATLGYAKGIDWKKLCSMCTRRLEAGTDG
jgi:hypothetical protein